MTGFLNKKRMIKKSIWTVLLILIAAFQIEAQETQKIIINEDIELIHLKDSIFIHKTWEDSETYGRFSSNGMIIIKNKQAIMIDTPMDNEKTKKITEYLKDSMHVELTKLIIGHYHTDCLGGLEYIHSKGIESIANSRTISKCTELDLEIPTTSFNDSLIINFNGKIIKCHFFGGGHTFDNITVWIPDNKILFGGCLVKTYNAIALGNIADAVIDDWSKTIQNTLNQYSDIKIVVPGHGEYGGSELLDHTIELVEKQKNKGI